jgi:alpha-glucoside transport system permease protein
MQQVLSALIAIAVGLGLTGLYFYGSNFLLDRLIRDTKNAQGDFKSREKQREAVRPWLFIFPALGILFLYLVYPAIETLRLSFLYQQPIYIDADDRYYIIQLATETTPELLIPATSDGQAIPSSKWEELGVDAIDRSTVNISQDFRSIERAVLGFKNYVRLISDPIFFESVRNNLLWILVVPSFSTALGLLIAVLADNIRWGSIAKSLIFMPMAISFVGASIIWKFVYAYDPDIGLINAIRFTFFGLEPVDVTQIPVWNNFALMVILVWIQTGFAMVLLGAALRGVPEETLEAARMDGANPFQLFFSIMIPQIANTILVVWTTILITVLKVFDIVLAMTNGQFGTQVMANYMFDMQFGQLNSGYASLLAFVIMLAVVPVMIFNVRRFLREEVYR